MTKLLIGCNFKDKGWVPICANCFWYRAALSKDVTTLSMKLKMRSSLTHLQSKCLRIATKAPWYIGNRQIHDDLVVPYFSDHIRSLTERFDSKLADVRKPLVGQLGRLLR